MATQERRINGDRWQLFAAAYEGAVEDGALLLDFDPDRVMFRYLHNPRLGMSLASTSQEVVVEVRPRDDFSCIVTVETRARSMFGLPQLYDWGVGRRIATRILDGLETRWAQPLRAFAEAGWLPDPEHAGATRFWDGHEWTPFVWYRDGALLLDTPEDGVPPLAGPKKLVGAMRYRRMQLRWVLPVAFFAAVIVVALVTR